MHFLSFSILLTLTYLIVFLAISSKRYSHYRHYGLSGGYNNKNNEEDEYHGFLLQSHSMKTITLLVLSILLVVTVFTIYEFGFLTGWMTLSTGIPNGSLVLSVMIHVGFVLLYGLLIILGLMSVIGVTFSVLCSMMEKLSIGVQLGFDYTGECALAATFANYVFLSVFVLELSLTSILCAMLIGSVIGIFIASGVTPMPAAIQYIKSDNNRLLDKLVSEYRYVDSYLKNSYQKVAIKALVKHKRWASIVSADKHGLPILTSDRCVSLLHADIKVILSDQLSIDQIDDIMKEMPVELKFITQRAYLEAVSECLS